MIKSVFAFHGTTHDFEPKLLEPQLLKSNGYFNISSPAKSSSSAVILADPDLTPLVTCHLEAIQKICPFRHSCPLRCTFNGNESGKNKLKLGFKVKRNVIA